jgi:hypothetical protein
MPGDIDNIIGPGHDKDITVLIDKSGICGFVVSWELLQIGADIAGVLFPKGGQRTRRQRKLNNESTDISGFDQLVLCIYNLDIPSRRRLGG